MVFNIDPEDIFILKDTLILMDQDLPMIEINYWSLHFLLEVIL